MGGGGTRIVHLPLGRAPRRDGVPPSHRRTVARVRQLELLLDPRELLEVRHDVPTNTLEGQHRP